VPGYHQEVWYSPDTICNIVGLCNLKRQYDKSDAFIVHRDSVEKPNMEFCMHSSGLHFFDPSKL
jgi:hypothetical protein